MYREPSGALAVMNVHGPMPRSSWLFPLLAVLFFAAATILGVDFSRTLPGVVFAVVLLTILFGTVFAAVHHAEVIAHEIGEPFGTLVLTMSVTIIEVALIATIMLGDKEVPTLARDTVFAVVMIVCNGLVGICILAGGLRYREQNFQMTGSSIYLSVLVVLATMTLVMPNFTTAAPGPVYTVGQLIFVSLVTIALYIVFLYTQTVRHRDYFIVEADDSPDPGIPLGRKLLINFGLLAVALLSVVLLAKKFSLVVDAATEMMGAPPAFAGVVVALLILMPEGVAAISAARKNDLQKSINLALGSSLATIGLTIPAVAVVAVTMGKTLVLGLSQQDIVVLLLTVAVSMLTFSTPRTNVLFGFVHLVVLAIYLFKIFSP
jgi:Ca2+:H+ antiporter